jgi:hypothetical protein
MQLHLHGKRPARRFPWRLHGRGDWLRTNITTPDPVCDDDDATVPYSDVPQPPTLTKTASNTQCRIDVTYDVVVTNGSAQDTLTLKTLNDDVYGNITQVQGNVISTTCGQTPGPGTLPIVIAASGNYSCSFVGRITSCNTTVKDTVTGTATDDDNANYTPSDDATVIVTVTTPAAQADAIRIRRRLTPRR